MPQLKFLPGFLKDMKRWKKSGRSMDPFDEFVLIVQKIWPPPPKYEPHMLAGTFKGLWDIHLRQNWVLLLQFENGILYFVRMGTHADLGL